MRRARTYYRRFFGVLLVAAVLIELARGVVM